MRSARAARRREHGDHDFDQERDSAWPLPLVEYAVTGLLPLALDPQDGQSAGVKAKIRMLVELELRMLLYSRRGQAMGDPETKRLTDALHKL